MSNPMSQVVKSTVTAEQTNQETEASFQLVFDTFHERLWTGPSQIIFYNLH